MKIGIDVSSLQGPHRMRGIGYTAINILRSLPHDSKDNFIFYVHPDDNESLTFIKDIVNLPTSRYSFRTFAPTTHKVQSIGQLRYVIKAFSKLRGLHAFRVGSDQYGKVDDLDAFLQLDQSSTLARLSGEAKNYLIGYDLIPYVLETDYLWGYKTARQNGRTRRSALKSVLNRYVYIKKIRLNSRKADIVFTTILHFLTVLP